ncbi:SRPBCC family protein [Micromonospora sp. NPDC018662]|uniref:SRPBCC family protein n=1 Tax=Micromonospora sp. NPDC018662 TaxID=3364238 RepID=UPI0037B38D79
MAMVRVEAVVDAPVQQVWDAVADVGAVHRRLLPGRVTDARVEGDIRILTMPDGHQVRELILGVDHGLRRMAYAVVEGQRLPLTYHYAAFQVLDEGPRSRLVWLTDVLPHDMADAVRARVERGMAEMKAVLERDETS